MKKHIFTLLLLISMLIAAHAQTFTRVVKNPIDSTANVEDSSGVRYPYPVWMKMLRDGYSLRRIETGDTSTVYLLYKMNETQKQAMFARMPMPPQSPFFTTNQKFDFFKGRAIDGYKVNPDSLAGKVVVFNFWFIGCPPCRAEIPELDKLAEQYKNNPNVVFVAVALDERYDVKRYIASHPFNYHMLTDGRYFTDKLHINTYPTNVIVDKEGKVRFHTTGYGDITPYWLKKTIQQLSAE